MYATQKMYKRAQKHRCKLAIDLRGISTIEELTYYVYVYRKFSGSYKYFYNYDAFFKNPKLLVNCLSLTQSLRYLVDFISIKPGGPFSERQTSGQSYY